MNARLLLIAAIWTICLPSCSRARAPLQVPDRLVVLTFDDASRSHLTFVRPLLKELGFGATFFVTEGYGFKTNKEHYLRWEEIKELSDDGFEIGNHTELHRPVTPRHAPELAASLATIDARCRRYGIPKPRSFAWPGNIISEAGHAVLKRYGMRLARRGGRPEFARMGGNGPAYEPARDDPLLIPSVAIPTPRWSLEGLIAAAGQARDGRIAVFQFHGVPDGEHPLTSTSPELFAAFMRHLHANGYRAIALRDVAPYIDHAALASDPWHTIEARQAGRER